MELLLADNVHILLGQVFHQGDFFFYVKVSLGGGSSRSDGCRRGEFEVGWLTHHLHMNHASLHIGDVQSMWNECARDVE